MKIPKTLFIPLFLILTHTLFGGDKPNIVWITSEDNSAYYIGCYGNENALTPNIDQLAKDGYRFEHAYSNAPVCAVTRGAILTGVYAVTQGTQHMRSRYPIPSQFIPYTRYLQKEGYYCSNADKTDYNFKGNDKSYWDDCSPTAHFKNRKEGQPFFSVFNFTSSHEHCLFPKSVKRYREQGAIPQTNRVSKDDVIIPPLYPDLPEIRQDLANYHDAITRMDKQVGDILNQLEEAGLAENTIVFYYSDHGGILPRSKRYLYETGTRVAMVVHVPEKWKHLSPFQTGQTVHETVSFVDLPATLLSLIGIEKPEYMMGRAFMGKYAEEQTDPMVFLHGDRFDEYYKFNRAITDGTFRYIRNFLPNQSASLRIYYPYQMDSWNACKKAWEEGKLTEAQAMMWQATQPVEELYDTANDPWELKNLADDPQYQDLKMKMQKVLVERMTSFNDLGFFPEAMFEELCGQEPVYNFAQTNGYPIETVVDIALKATNPGDQHNEIIKNAIASSNPIVRYWGLMGYLNAPEIKPSKAVLEKLLNDEYSANRIRACQVLHQTDKKAAVNGMLRELELAKSDEVMTLALNVMDQIEAVPTISETLLNDLIEEKKTYIYASRLAETFLEI